MQIRIVFVAALLLAFAGCSQPYINFTIDAPQISNGTFTVYDDNNTMVYGVNIKNGKLKFEHQYLKQPGYYTFKIVDNDVRTFNRPAEIYLEPGDYHIKVDKRGYPLITGTSATQNDLTAYYRSEDSTTLARFKRVQYYDLLQKNSGNASVVAAKALDDTIAKAKALLKNVGFDVLRIFIKTHPKSMVAVHMMSDIDFKNDPDKYYTLFKNLSADARNSDDGKDINQALIAQLALQPGHTAPDIIGQTPDGKPFKKTGLDKKIYLVEFWKAGSTMTRANHMEDKLSAMMSLIHDPNDFGMIGVSMDHKRDWWLDAIKVDKLTWPQYSDLKGNDSENVTNWQTTILPAYSLVDNKWHIIEANIDFVEVPVLVNRYLNSH